MSRAARVRPARRFEMKVCHHCGRIVARQPCYSTGKGCVRHKCPHGVWCSSASHFTATDNTSHSCALCRKAVVDAERVGLKPFAESYAQLAASKNNALQRSVPRTMLP